jgi:hypothetical protein
MTRNSIPPERTYTVQWGENLGPWRTALLYTTEVAIGTTYRLLCNHRGLVPLQSALTKSQLEGGFFWHWADVVFTEYHHAEICIGLAPTRYNTVKIDHPMDHRTVVATMCQTCDRPTSTIPHPLLQ